jgi:hypothetical protein
LSWLITKNAAQNLANRRVSQNKDEQKIRKGTAQEERNERKEDINRHRERKNKLPHFYVLKICVE